MDYEEIVERYEKLREKCYRAMKNDVKTLGSDAWLYFAIKENELELFVLGSGSINCSGNTYTTQTMSTESFSFILSKEEIENA